MAGAGNAVVGVAVTTAGVLTVTPSVELLLCFSSSSSSSSSLSLSWVSGGCPRGLVDLARVVSRLLKSLVAATRTPDSEDDAAVFGDVAGLATGAVACACRGRSR